jgi:hypothetical protein
VAEKYMYCYTVNIAGYKIRFESQENGPALIPGKRFMQYIAGEVIPDVLIRVRKGNPGIPASSKMVFNAPYIEEINGSRIKKSDEFWKVFKNDDDIFITCNFPDPSTAGKSLLKFSLNSKVWDLWFDGCSDPTDPLEYPLDGLILYYLTVIHGDILIHASGVNHNGKGYLFSGVSGKGKTTMARLWDRPGTRIIHDDRLIIRNDGNSYKMYNTPVYLNETPSESPLHKIFIIEHSMKNEIAPVTGAKAASLVMSNCIQHNWDSAIIERLLGAVSTMCDNIPVSLLRFRPDESVISYILANE